MLSFADLNSSRLVLYGAIIMAKQHDRKAFRKLIKIAIKDGFCIKLRKDKVFVYAQNGEQYLAHQGERAYHPLRRFLKRNSTSLLYSN